MASRWLSNETGQDPRRHKRAPYSLRMAPRRQYCGSKSSRSAQDATCHTSIKMIRYLFWRTLSGPQNKPHEGQNGLPPRTINSFFDWNSWSDDTHETPVFPHWNERKQGEEGRGKKENGREKIRKPEKESNRLRFFKASGVPWQRFFDLPGISIFTQSKLHKWQNDLFYKSRFGPPKGTEKDPEE